MSEAIRSKRPLGSRTVTRAFVTKDDDAETALVQADVTSISVFAYRKNERSEFWSALDIDPADNDPIATIYDTPVVPASWTQGSVGYNFKSKIEYASDGYTPQPNEATRIEFVFVLADGSTFTLIHYASYDDVKAISGGTVDV